MTQSQLNELIESDQVKALVERSEERGFLEPAELEAFVLEHELNDEETEQLTRELETLGLEVGQALADAAKAAAAAKDEEKEEKEQARLVDAPVATGALVVLRRRRSRGRGDPLRDRNKSANFAFQSASA